MNTTVFLSFSVEVPVARQRNRLATHQRSNWRAETNLCLPSSICNRQCIVLPPILIPESSMHSQVCRAIMDFYFQGTTCQPKVPPVNMKRSWWRSTWLIWGSADLVQAKSWYRLSEAVTRGTTSSREAMEQFWGPVNWRSDAWLFLSKSSAFFAGGLQHLMYFY